MFCMKTGFGSSLFSAYTALPKKISNFGVKYEMFMYAYRIYSKEAYNRIVQFFFQPYISFNFRKTKRRSHFDCSGFFRTTPSIRMAFVFTLFMEAVI